MQFRLHLASLFECPYEFQKVKPSCQKKHSHELPVSTFKERSCAILAYSIYPKDRVNERFAGASFSKIGSTTGSEWLKSSQQHVDALYIQHMSSTNVASSICLVPMLAVASGIFSEVPASMIRNPFFRSPAAMSPYRGLYPIPQTTSNNRLSTTCNDLSGFSAVLL